MADDLPTLDALEPFIGEWRMAPEADWSPDAGEDTGARVTFTWLEGRRFLVQRWTIPIPEAPDGIAIIGPDPATPGGYLQHYFDSRGVARTYRMTFADGRWTLTREEADLSPLHFRQRFTGTFGDDARTIRGAWEIDEGDGWRHDFGLTYAKV